MVADRDRDVGRAFDLLVAERLWADSHDCVIPGNQAIL